MIETISVQRDIGKQDGVKLVIDVEEIVLDGDDRATSQPFLSHSNENSGLSAVNTSVALRLISSSMIAPTTAFERKRLKKDSFNGLTWVTHRKI